MGSYPSTKFVEKEWTRDKGEKDEANERARPVDTQLTERNVNVVQGEKKIKSGVH